MSHLYLDESLDLADVAPGATVHLSGDEARHAVTVSRVRRGERIAIGDGRGTLVHGAVASTGQRELALEVDEVIVEEASSPRLILVQALAKGDRDELAVQAATELGVDAVVPWQAARSVSRWEGPKAEKGRLRWVSIVREAVKQSIRAWLPTVLPVTATAGLPAALEGCRMLLLEPTATTPLTELRPDRVHVLVRGRIVASGGPELADVVERDGYAAFVAPGEPLAEEDVEARATADPFADPFAGR